MRRVALTASVLGVLGLAVFLAVHFVTERFDPNPPSLRITADGTEIPVLQGSYCWKNTCADTAAPPELVQSTTYNTVVLPQFAKLQLTFETAPKTLSFTWWGEDRTFTEQLPAATRHVSLEAPTVPGRHVMEFTATWDGGQASYAVQIETR